MRILFLNSSFQDEDVVKRFPKISETINLKLRMPVFARTNSIRDAVYYRLLEENLWRIYGYITEQKD